MQVNAITVTELNKYVKEKIANDEFLQNVLVKGELSNFKVHYTGHIYFTLKDETSLLKGIMFKTYASNLKFKPQDGMSVVIYGSVSVFERDGIYQIYCKDMILDGLGALYTKYEELKKKLEMQGMFSTAHKKKIPSYATNIGVVTSQTGSVIRDILNVSLRRNPNINIKLIPSAVQGDGAKEQIVRAIKKFNELNNVDVIILARGGGSLEDLWPFNEEIVAQAIFDSKIPIISAVGHETDFSISDFVADLRAPTPSAAAELAVFDVNEVKWKIENYKNNMKILLTKKLNDIKSRYNVVKSSQVFSNPLSIIQVKQQILDNDIKDLTNIIEKIYHTNKTKFVELTSILDSISPLKTLQRGYVVAQTINGKIVKKSSELEKSEQIYLQFTDDKRLVEVIE